MRKAREGFFALDVNQFELIRRHGLGVEDAATYLSLLKSTDQSNIISSGGVNSVMTYTGLTRSEVKKAIARLEAHGLLKSLEVARKRARTASRYKLPVNDDRQELSDFESGVVKDIGAGAQPSNPQETQAAHRAARKGWIEKRSGKWELLERANTVAFIPNNFVAASSGDSPLTRLVNAGELGPIMLATELYQLQNLMDDRGVPPDIIRAYYHPESSMNLGNHRLHSLVSGREWTNEETGERTSSSHAHSYRHWRSSQTLWDDLSVLDATHVIEWAIYSANGKPKGKFDFNRPQRPLGVLRNGRQVLQTPESRPAFMAYLVSRLAEGGVQSIDDIQPYIEEWVAESPLIAMENRAVPHVEAIGILRMTTRALTENTTVWYRELSAECDKAFFFIDEIARTNFPHIFDKNDKITNPILLGDAISKGVNA